jgi:hypothetical protein
LNRASAETQDQAALREGMAPLMRWLKRVVDRILGQVLGWPDLEFVWQDTTEQDPETQARIAVSLVGAGITTRNEARATLGLPPLQGGDALTTAGPAVPMGEAGMAKAADWNPDAHPRWPEGAPDSQGGRFAPKDDDAAQVGDVSLEAQTADVSPPADASTAPADPAQTRDAEIESGNLDDGAVTRESSNVSNDKDDVPETRSKIVQIAASNIDSRAWSYGARNGWYGKQTDKCNLFVHDILTQAGASPGTPNGFFHVYPPTAEQWADPNYFIPGFRVLGPNEAPEPGDVVAQKLGYSDATGHVMIIGSHHDFIGTGNSGNGPHGTIEDIPFRDNLGPAEIARGPLVFRRWVGQN